MGFCEFQWMREQFEAMKKHLERLELQLKLQGEKIKMQIDDLNAAIQAEDVEITDLVTVMTKVDTDLAALKAAVDAGGSGPSLSDQIQAIQSHTAALKTALDQLKAADDAAVPPTPPVA